MFRDSFTWVPGGAYAQYQTPAAALQWSSHEQNSTPLSISSILLEMGKTNNLSPPRYDVINQSLSATAYLRRQREITQIAKS
ncbi:hypothetical protein RRG08_032058 [Elysia crispata]|uniref:Uncharacterized protein n=1 Tax=Elysia crispata TaxID=231223 RepID=A0AAE1DFX3_9GAST|nr:hypothetical protein RRG08_032058 [Elysia crispata]